MKLESFTYKGVEYQVGEIVKLGENRFQIRTTDNKSFLVQFNEALFRWVISEENPPADRTNNS